MNSKTKAAVQARRYIKYRSRSILPVEQDHWDLLTKEIHSISPVEEKHSNAVWAIIGFSGSLILSAGFYSFSGEPNFVIIAVAITLAVSLLLAARAYQKVHLIEKATQKMHIKRCVEMMEFIEDHFEIDDTTVIPTSEESDQSQSEYNKSPTTNIEHSESRPDTKSILKELVTKRKEPYG